MIAVEQVAVDSPLFDGVRRVRRVVFVDEQGVNPANEFDAIDEIAMHLLATYEGEPAGTARLYAEGGVARIGRVAVLARFRGLGIGGAIMLRALDTARLQGYAEVLLHSQTQAAPFYEGMGFTVEGEEYVEEGIPHYTMRRTL